MWHVLMFFKWKASWWRVQGELRNNVTADIASGLKAYAEKQAVIYERRAHRFAHRWLPVLKAYGVTPEWAVTYSDTDKPSALYANNADSESGVEVDDDNDSSIEIDEEYNSDFEV